MASFRASRAGQRLRTMIEEGQIPTSAPANPPATATATATDRTKLDEQKRRARTVLNAGVGLG